MHCKFLWLHYEVFFKVNCTVIAMIRMIAQLQKHQRPEWRKEDVSPIYHSILYVLIQCHSLVEEVASLLEQRPQKKDSQVPSMTPLQFDMLLASRRPQLSISDF